MSERKRKFFLLHEDVDDDDESSTPRTRQLLHEFSPPPSPPPSSEIGDQPMDLSLSLAITRPPEPQPPLPPPPPPPPAGDFFQLLQIPAYSPPLPPPQPVVRSTGNRRRRSTAQQPREGRSKTITPPFPWATDRRASIDSLVHLGERNITTITGQVHCKNCDKHYQYAFDLQKKFQEVRELIASQKEEFFQRAPDSWKNPPLLKCVKCDEEKCVKPVVGGRKRCINWLFLLLGQQLGFCTLEQLKYFCKHAEHHRTGAKDRVLYLTYLGLCKQLDPEDPTFNR